MKRIAIFLLLLCATPASHAQSLKTWTLAELSKRSDLVCTGTVLKVEVIEEKKAEDLLSYTPPPPKRMTVARIKVISTMKGSAPDEIEMRYPEYKPRPIDWGADVSNDRINLLPGNVYCFYLKRVEGELWYVSALDGGEEDSAAVQQKGGPLLSKKEAIDIASIEYLKSDPAAVITPKLIEANCDKSAFPAWVVRFYSAKHAGDDFWDARIFVNQDKSIGDRSVIFGRPGDNYNKALTGKHFTLRVTPPRSSIPRTLSGVIKKTDGRTITLSTDGMGNAPATEIIPKGAIQSLQPLPDSCPAQ